MSYNCGDDAMFALTTPAETPREAIKKFAESVLDMKDIHFNFMGIVARKEDEGMMFVTSIVSGRTFEPLVQIEWGEKSCQFGLNEAREHALGILEAAEAAESDAFVFQWLTRDIIGTAEDEKDNFQQVIEEFKQFRLARSKSEKGEDRHG